MPSRRRASASTPRRRRIARRRRPTRGIVRHRGAGRCGLGTVAAPAVAAPRPRAASRARASRSGCRSADPYIELRTGPGRGYPIFFVAPRDDWIEIELRHTDWFRVRTDDGKVGWVSRQQLETTLTAAGEHEELS